MSGHNKWSQIKRQKHATDVKKGAVYGCYSKEISSAVKIGGSQDPEYNTRLRNVLERARVVGVPNDVIKRALNKFNENNSENFEEILYEGYGVDGVAVMVEVYTENRNRTVAELRHVFIKNDGSLGESGCVSWNFKKLAVIYLKRREKQENLEDFLLEINNIEDIDLDSDEENALIFVHPDNLEKVQSQIRENYECSSEIEYIAQNHIEIIDEEKEEKINKLIDLLEELDDVQRVFHNAIC